MDSTAPNNSATSGPGNEMVNGRDKLPWLPDDAAHRATFRKRRNSVIKKARELSILCDVKAAAIIYGSHESKPEVWPNVKAAAAVLETFQSMPEMEQTKKMVNQEKFIGDRIMRTSMQLEKVQKEIHEGECTALMFRCMADMKRVQELDIMAVMSLALTVETKMKTVKDRIEELTKQQKADAEVQSQLEVPLQQTIMVPAVMPAPECGDGIANQISWPADLSTPTPVFGDGSSSNIDDLINNSMDDVNSKVGFDDPSWADHFFP